MNEIMAKIQEFFSGGGAMQHALVGLLILIGGLFIVKVLSGFIRKLLQKVSFLHVKNKDGTETDLASPIASLIKALLTVFVLIAVLQHFGLTEVLAPIQIMLGEFLNAIPRIIGAGVVGYAGWIIAKIISEITGMALGKLDEQIETRTGNDDIKVAPFFTVFVFGAIFIPVLVAALGVLNIPAISVPAMTMLTELFAAIPNIIAAIIIVVVTYFVLKFVISLLNGLFAGLDIDALPAKFGMDKLFGGNMTLTSFINGTIMFFGMLAAIVAAVGILDIPVITSIFAGILQFGGNIFVGGLILVIGNVLSQVAYNNLKSQGALANIARFAILGLTLAMGLRAMGIADNIVNLAFGFTIGAVAIAFALAFGFGGRDAAKTVADTWAKKLK